MMLWTLSNVFILLVSSVKIMSYAKLSEKLGELVTMIKEVIVKIWPILIFLIWWITVFSFLYRICGIEVSKDDYPDVRLEFVYWL
jgi:hypothetical protein